jgi:16S rRNA (adenine1518-N6/adenine1519-N6)-dimethyltransferase
VRFAEQADEFADERELGLGRGVHGPVVSRRLPAKIPVSPRRELGQHFLVDENILGVIGRLAQLDSADVVLEVGPGLGILTRFLADRVARVHAVEIDRSLAPRLANLPPNVELEFGDALAVDLGRLQPTKLVANLPYSVATPLVVESLGRLPTVGLWCVMVQREVADRFFAEPRTKAYGAVSVVVQLAAERTGFHPVSRTVFRPQPNVDSALLAFRRVPPPDVVPWGDLKRVVEAAFAHRRKTLPNSLELAGLSSRERAAEALAALDRPARTRAEELSPQEFVALAETL